MLFVNTYLARIRYTGSITPNINTLRALHCAHMLAVPFENLDIAVGRKIVIEEDAVLHKIIDERRGGFCYELNGAFGALLRALGFKVTLLSARVARAHGGEGPEFDHLALLVHLEEPWLADVGFGDSFLEPLKLRTEVEQLDPSGTFRLMQAGQRFRLEKLELDSDWKEQYSFALQPRQFSDFAGMCHYHQTSPDSSFTRSTICSLATQEGRITLSGMKWIVTRNGHREERELNSKRERTAILRDQFGIVEPVAAPNSPK